MPFEEKSKLLPRRVSTIDPQVRCRHKAARIANEEHCSASILLWHTQLSQHVLRGPIPLSLRILLKQGFYHGSLDISRRNGINSNTVMAPFGGEVACQLHYGSFAGVVGGTDKTLVEEAGSTYGFRSTLEADRVWRQVTYFIRNRAAH